MLMPNERQDTKSVVVIGAGPAGLMAAEVMVAAGLRVDVYDAMPSVGRKLLLAGIGGLNITHAEDFETFVKHYGVRCAQIRPWFSGSDGLSPQALRAWVQGLGIDTFVGTSGHVFPQDMKAAPLLRAWLHRLRSQGVRFHARHRWLGWTAHGGLQFVHPSGLSEVSADATVLALGGASWKKLGSDGAWVACLQALGVEVKPLIPANCGFDLAQPWSEHLRSQFAGKPLKPVALHLKDSSGHEFRKLGEFVITDTGVEGSLIYAASRWIRDEIAHSGQATVHLDLLPAFSLERVQAEVSHPRGSKSWSAHLKSRLNLQGLKTALLYETLSKTQLHNTAVLAQTIKALPLTLSAARPIDEAISSAGGVAFEAMDANLMLKTRPGVFCAGEMLDWEAPTGGYLLNACWASGRMAGLGVAQWLQKSCASR
jgi:uncharacterized flavoprotein (TIGR03862 family)